MGIEGRLDINFQVEGDQVQGVEIASSRPLRITSLFTGKSPEDVLALIPTVFSICGTAQTYAAVGAFEHALGIEVSAEVRAAREMAVWAETAREHLLRLVMMIGRPSQGFQVGELMPMAQQMKMALIPVFELGGLNVCVDMMKHIERLEDFLVRSVFGEPLNAWRQRQAWAELSPWIAQGSTDVAALLGCMEQKGWRRLGGEVALQGLPPLDGFEVLNAMKNPDFIAFPTWQGHSFETTPLARQAQEGLIRQMMAENGTGLMTRLSALLVELARIPARMRELRGAVKGEIISEARAGLEKGVGLAQVEAARGRLIHAVWMEQGRVADYRILAPTEWNFHPQGVAAKALKTVSFAGGDGANLKAQAEALISVIDPCVAFDVRIG